MLLAGCDDSSKAQVGVVDKAGKQNSEQQLDSTAIYLRSGVGLDFGRKPVSDVQGMQAEGKYRHVEFLFDEAPEVVDKAVREILEASNYKREIVKSSDYKLQVIYRKVGVDKPDLANTLYSEVPAGDKVKTKLLLSWYID
jgi:hypothetical protein